MFLNRSGRNRKESKGNPSISSKFFRWIKENKIPRQWRTRKSNRYCLLSLDLCPGLKVAQVSVAQWQQKNNNNTTAEISEKESREKKPLQRPPEKNYHANHISFNLFDFFMTNRGFVAKKMDMTSSYCKLSNQYQP